MSGTKAEEAAALLKRFSAEEKARFAVMSVEVFGKPVPFTAESLAEWDPQDLETLCKILGGMILTKEHAPLLEIMLSDLKDADLPSEVEFGRIDDGGR
ncbi:hypothetical protein [Paenibacillus sp. UNC499MF]|uniref:hypothetical protein n=1 Tax=Paenibacillus sp. UNC499MF TaxID=1502751 RepID=UPI0008A06E42|nr:hypothetical protein [Paenibacillus sp. UNC499MF]SEG07794.1 hypothetical protein SAMN02799616_01769 [Paenibacillus sp. UNC499MF]